MNSHIPKDLHREILSRLPAKSLSRFRCVNKAWYILIEDPDLRNKVNRLLVLTGNTNVRSTRTCLSSIETRRVDQLEKFRGNIFVHGSCNGIICLGFRSLGSSEYNHIALWNPTTGGFRFLDDCPFLLSPQDQIAFGYDHKNNDYKVVTIQAHKNYSGEIAIFSLTTGSWRKVEDKRSDIDFNRNCLPSYLNGVYYLIAKDGKKILAFDMQEEDFHVIPIPQSNLNLDPSERVRAWEVTVMNDSLALVLTCQIYWRRSSFHIWLFDINSGSKRKHATIKGPVGDFAVGFDSFLGFWTDCNVVVIKDVRRDVLLYNVTSQETTRMYSVDMKADPRLITCAESLVSVSSEGFCKWKKITSKLS